MKAVKDHFSAQAESYSAFRPRDPDALPEFLFSVPSQKEIAEVCIPIFVKAGGI
jgi:hypothetical protein